jgi:hypothetical protein
MIRHGQIFEASVGLLAVAALVLTFIWALLKEKRGKPAATKSMEQKSLSQVPDTDKMLSESGVDVTYSVTEHTTARLGEKSAIQVENPGFDRR